MEGRQKGILLLRKDRDCCCGGLWFLTCRAGGWILTKDKSESTKDKFKRVGERKNEGWENMADNPLLKGEYPPGDPGSGGVLQCAWR